MEDIESMDGQVGTVPTMRSADRWLAGLRIAVGVWFAKAIFTKLSVTLAWGFLPVPTASDRWLHVMPILVTKYAEGNPIDFFGQFRERPAIVLFDECDTRWIRRYRAFKTF